jgi:hypothetical protein
MISNQKKTGGMRKNPPIGLITGRPADVNNKYVSGAGVGASNIFCHRAKLRCATICNEHAPCGKFIMRLGIYGVV